MSENLNFSNTNSLWGSFLAEALHRFGIGHAVVSPGSRSAPLAHALALHPAIRATPVLDERSAGFFALGLARRTRRPVVLVCTSGTAAANFYPALIEARESRVPLLVLTADRPPEMRDCSSGQTIDQVKIFGHYPRWQVELALPEPSLKLLAYLRQTLRQACERALWPVAGPVHLNVPFRDPLAPVADGSVDDLPKESVAALLEDLLPARPGPPGAGREEVETGIALLAKSVRLLIVAGPSAPGDRRAYNRAIAQLADLRKAPVLADVLSPCRHSPEPFAFLVEHYDAILEQGLVPDDPPDLVLRLGGLPTSKRLRAWLQEIDCPHLVLEEGDQNLDPLHSRCLHIRGEPISLLAEVVRQLPEQEGPFGDRWRRVNEGVRERISRSLETCEALFEGKVPWLLGRHLPAGCTVFISNSMPVRDAEFFWQAGRRAVEVFFNRGANGIDGIVSTALGIAMESTQTVLLTGELAFLHDQNGLLSARAISSGLTIIVINNGGGGIFQSLPIAGFDPPFTQFFLTPQEVDLGKICQAHGIDHERVTSWSRFIEQIEMEWTTGVRVLEVATEPGQDRTTRARVLSGG